MTEPYSLARQAWIPVALDDGQRVFVRPCDISQPFDDRTILRVATGRPDCDISLTEFLIGLLAVALGPQDRQEWAHRYRNPPTASELAAAFAPFDAAMNLDGEGPRFFQDLEQFEANSPDKGWKRLDQLFVDGCGEKTLDENADHFTKRNRFGILSRSGAAIALLTIQTLSPQGGAGKFTSIRGGGPLTTLIVPGTYMSDTPLWRVLWANVPSGFVAGSGSVPRIFPWMVPTRSGAKGGIKTTPVDVDPAQVFFGLPRRLRLEFAPNTDGRTCDLLGIHDDWIIKRFCDRPNGTDYTAWSRSHPLSPYYKSRETDPEFFPQPLRTSKAGYRQWLGMILATPNGLRLPAKCVAEFPQRARALVPRDDITLRRSRVLCAGYIMDQNSPLDFAEALLPLIITGSAETDAAVKDLARRWVEAADMVASQTVSAVRLALYGEKTKVDRDSTVLEAVNARFWADTDDDFYDALRRAGDTLEAEVDTDRHTEQTRVSSAAWLTQMRRHALRLFDDAVPIEEAESHRVRDIITGRKNLGLMLNGYGKGGAALFALLDQPSPEAKPKKGRGAK